MNRRVEQLAARWAHNTEVAGSSPAPATVSASARLNAEYAGEPGSLITPPLKPASIAMGAGIFSAMEHARAKLACTLAMNLSSISNGLVQPVHIDI